MPSSHAQFVSFFSLSLGLFLLLRHKPHPVNTYSAMSLVERGSVSLFACLGAGLVAASRVYLNYHTPRQVLVGCAAGITCAIVWFLVIGSLRQRGWVDRLLETRVARMLRMRDLCITEDIMDAGWGRWEERRKFKRELSNKSQMKNQ